jgi:hypothetical protein
MATFKHNKKRDCGLVYEFLVRQLSKTMVEKDQSGYKRTLEIVRKYYGEGTPLAEERELFDVIRNARGLSETSARRVLGEVERHATRLDSKKIDIKKSNLIKEINYTYGREFFSSHRVPDYRLLASIQMVIDAARTQNRLTESVQKIQLEEGLVRYMTTRGSFNESTTQRSDVDALVMAMVAKRFNEKYSKTLSVSQKKLLEKYIRFQVTGDMKPLTEIVVSELKRINDVLTRASMMREVIEDSAMSKKLEEARQKLLAEGAMPVEQQVEDIMMYQNLAEEVESNE